MKTEQILKEYSLFRRNMGIPIDKKVYLKFWGNRILDGIDIKEINSSILKEKIDIAKISLKSLMLFDWVKFIAISGSVASGFAKNEDDIDIFIIVKNNRAWIYRGIILFMDIFHKKIRVEGNGRNVKDKLCVNFITEERNLSLESDIFNLNEIISLIPLYNEEYFTNLLENNKWIFDKYSVSKRLLDGGYTKNDLKRYPLFFFVNLFFLYPQLLHMIVFNHKPDINRIMENFKNGRIEFFPKNFKKEKLNDLKSR